MAQYVNNNVVRTTGRFAPSVNYNTTVRRVTPTPPDLPDVNASFNIDLSSIGDAVRDANRLDLERAKLRYASLQTKKAEKDYALLNAYTSELNNIQLCVSQGVLSEQDALVKTRSINNKYLGLGLPANSMGTVYNYFGGGQLQRDDEQRDMLLKNQTEQDLGFANNYIKNNPAASNMPLSYQVMKGKEAAQAQTSFYNDMLAASVYSPETDEHKMHKEAADNDAISMTDYDLSTAMGTILNDASSTPLQKRVMLSQFVRSKGLERGLLPSQAEEVTNQLLDTYKDTLELNNLTTLKNNIEMQENLQKYALLDYKNRMYLANGDNYLNYLTSSNFNKMIQEASMTNISPLKPPVQYDSAEMYVKNPPNPNNVVALKNTPYEARWATAYNNRLDTIARTYMPADLNDYLTNAQKNVYDENIRNMANEFEPLYNTGVSPEIMNKARFKLQSELGMQAYSNMTKDQQVAFDNVIDSFKNDTAKEMLLLKDGNLVVSRDVWDKNKSIFSNLYNVTNMNLNSDEINRRLNDINNYLRMYNQETREQLLRAAFYKRDNYVLRDWTEADGEVFDGTNPTFTSRAVNAVADNINRGTTAMVNAIDTGVNKAISGAAATADYNPVTYVAEAITDDIVNNVSPATQQKMIDISNNISDIVKAARNNDTFARDEAIVKAIMNAASIDYNLQDYVSQDSFTRIKNRYGNDWNNHLKNLGYASEDEYKNDLSTLYAEDLIGNINKLRYFMPGNTLLRVASAVSEETKNYIEGKEIKTFAKLNNLKDKFIKILEDIREYIW